MSALLKDVLEGLLGLRRKKETLEWSTLLLPEMNWTKVQRTIRLISLEEGRWALP